MASFGISTHDNNFSSFVDGTNTPYLYWGSRIVSFPAVPTDSSTDDVIIDAFNFPSSWNVSFFFLSNVTGMGVRAYKINSGGRWKIGIDWVSASRSGSITVYAFVEGYRISPPRYGLGVYNSSGVCVFHSGRPSLNIREVGRYSGGYKPASTCELSFSDSQLVPPVDNERNIIRFDGVYPSGTSYSFGYESVRIHGSIGIAVSNRQTLTPVIDAGYYDQFSSLPDY